MRGIGRLALASFLASLAIASLFWAVQWAYAAFVNSAASRGVLSYESYATATPTPSGSPTPGDIAWTTKAPLPVARAYLGATAASNGRIYAIGGGPSLSTVEEYDPATDTWTAKANMPTPRYSVGLATASNGRIYAIGGRTWGGASLSTVEEYDPATDTWATKANMPTARGILGVAAAGNGRIYAVGGWTGESLSSAVEEYDPATDTWATKARMPTARDSLGLAAGTNGRLYAIGGGVSGSTPLATVEEYDPATDTWATKASMPTARLYLGVATGTNGRIYAVGGGNPGFYAQATVEEYDPTTDTWTSKASMPTARASLGVAVAANGRIYAVGGWGNVGPVATVEEGTLSGSLTPLPSYTPTSTPTATPMPSPTATPTLTATPSPPIAYLISGRVTDVSGAPLGGVTISDGLGHITATLSDGSYTLSGLTAGAHTITPTKGDYSFAPESPTVVLSPTAPRAALDFRGGRTPVVVVPGVEGSELRIHTADGTPYTLRATLPDGTGPYSRTYANGDVVWPPPPETLCPICEPWYVLPLFPSTGAPLSASDLVRFYYVPLPFASRGFYQPILDSLAEQHIVRPFPYDWRLGNEETARKLGDAITDWLEQANGHEPDPDKWVVKKVDIVAHSMGGLVAKYYSGLQFADRNGAQRVGADRIRKLITLGTPYLGSPMTLQEYLYGRGLGPFELFLAEQAKYLSREILSNFQLMPSRSYYGFYNYDGNPYGGTPPPDVQAGDPRLRPVPLRDESDMDKNGVTGALGYDQLRQFLLNLGYGRTADLLPQAEGFQRRLDAIWTEPGNRPMEVHSIVGSGQYTMGQIRVRSRFQKDLPEGLSYRTDPVPEAVEVNGDHTVPLYSAALRDEVRSDRSRSDYDSSRDPATPILGSGDRSFYQVHYICGTDDPDVNPGGSKIDHEGLMTDKAVLDFVNRLLNGATLLMLDGADGDYDDSGTIRVEPCRTPTAWRIVVLSPVDLHVYDQQGRHTGKLPDGTIERAVAGVSYEELGESKYVFLTRVGTYAVVLRSTVAHGGASFDLKLERHSGGLVTETVNYLDVPVIPGTVATLQVETAGTTPPTLRLDSDGDGTVDFLQTASSVLDQTQSQDWEPPLVQVVSPSQDSLQKGPVVIRWTADDANSGVLKELAIVDEGTAQATETMNSRPVVLSTGQHKLTVLAEDRAGNWARAEVRFFVDDVPPTTGATLMPSPDAAGWNSGSVTVTLSATDNESGAGVKEITYSAGGAQPLDSTTVSGGSASIDITAEGQTVLTYAAKDNLGNQEAAKALTIRIDKTPPTVRCNAADGSWHASDASIGCTASDGLSGLAVPGDASFVLSTNVAHGVETANAATGSRIVCDVAGNCATAGPIGGNKVDRKAPAITIAVPTGTIYTLNQAVAASYACTDGGSGVATCAGPVPVGANVDTASVGSKTFTVNAADKVGNAASQTVSYQVSYGINPLYDQTKVHKLGSTVPIKLQLVDASGSSQSSPAITVHAAALSQVGTGATGVPEDSGGANPDNSFRYDPALQGYIYNLSTKALSVGTWKLVFTVAGDPQQHEVQFAVR